MGKPERRHVVGIKLQADTWRDVVGHLYDIARYLEEMGPGRELISGGYSAGYIVIDKENPTTSHDDYFKKLDKFLEKNREGKETVTVDTSISDKSRYEK